MAAGRLTRFLRKLFLGNVYNRSPENPSVLQTQNQNLKKIWNNEQHNDIGVERLFRLFLYSSLYLFPGLYIRHFFAKLGLDAKMLAVELYVIFKTCVPLVFLFSGFYHSGVLISISVYLLCETLVYITSLIFVSDVYHRPRSIRRSLFLLFFNYMEIAFDFAVIYSGMHMLNVKSHRVIDHIYFSLITSASIGFGDIHPVTGLGKLVASMQSVIFLIFIVLFLNFFSSKVKAIGYTEKEDV